MKVIVADNAGVSYHIPESHIFCYYADATDPTKTTVVHAANGTQIYKSTFDGTPADLDAILTS
ncbi:hypothetical protein forsur_14 [Escherichia phage forsur]|nr:hypothetical protein forsur_14 [Escherichia phage forsur]